MRPQTRHLDSFISCVGYSRMRFRYYGVVFQAKSQEPFILKNIVFGDSRFMLADWAEIKGCPPGST